jgi:predicted DNA-binding WGR domain protein
MPAVYVERSDRTRNLARFYQVDIQPTLFGRPGCSLPVVRIGTYGRVQQDWFESLLEAQAAQAQPVANKCVRGYSS